jgi:hypothetical protein
MMQQHHERRQNEIAIGLALGGDEASLRSKGSYPNLDTGSYPADVKGKDRDEAYEMNIVESPYSANNSNKQSRPGRPVQQVAPVLQHPGYGRQGSRPGSGGSGGAHRGLTDEDLRRGNVL